MTEQQAPKGTSDILPPEGERLDALEASFASLARRYGYRRIVTPTFEHTDVFLRVGESTDIVRKEMYTFEELFRSYLAARSDELCAECRERIALNPLRTLDCKNPRCRAVTDGAPHFVDHLCEPCREHFAALTAGLDAYGWPWRVEPRLV